MSGLSKATVIRLPRYLSLLDDLNGASDTVSSASLATAADTNPANARRDLSVLGFQGTRGVGYSVPALRDRIRRELGIENRRKVAIVGAGNLGTALAGYSGLSKRGFDVVAIYDVNPKIVGKVVGDISVKEIGEMSSDGGVNFEMAILAVPARSAQGVADDLVAAGIASILNFAPVRIDVPETVAVRQVDLSTELQILSYYG